MALAWPGVLPALPLVVGLRVKGHHPLRKNDLGLKASLTLTELVYRVARRGRVGQQQPNVLARRDEARRLFTGTTAKPNRWG